MPKIKPYKSKKRNFKIEITKPIPVSDTYVYDSMRSYRIPANTNVTAGRNVPIEVIVDEITTSQTYQAYRNASVYKVIEIKDAYDGRIIYDWTEAIGFIELTEAVVYLHDRLRRFPDKKYDILPM